MAPRDSFVRQLSAVMFADIAGYTATMQRSEIEAVAQRDRFRAALADFIADYNGVVVQHYGDGTLSIFQSAVEATMCGLMVQRSMTVPPQVPLRIGLHSGDIVRDAEGVYGDGVNVAARVQALAVPGSVLISDRVAEAVKNHAELALNHLGEYELKNVARPMGILAVVDDTIIVPTQDDLRAARSRRAVAVLPFVNQSDDPSQDFFSEGISEDVINCLAQIPALKVTSRTSSFAFKRSDVDLREIARRLDVGHVLEGSVRTAGSHVRVTAQLVEATSGFQVFSHRWDRELNDVFAIQDELSAEIAHHLQEAFAGEEREPWAETRAGPDPRAYSLYLEGRHHGNAWSPEGALRSVGLYEQATEVDPAMAVAYAAMSTSLVFLGMVGRLHPEAAHTRAKSAALRALELQPSSYEAEAALALTAFFYDWEGDQADLHFERAIRLGPGSAIVHQYRGLCYSILGRHSLAIGAMETALDLDPLSASINNELARVLVAARDYEAALIQVERTLELAPAFRSARELKSIALWHLERRDAAIETMLEYRSQATSSYAGAAFLSYMYARTGDYEAASREFARLEDRERAGSGTALNIDFAISHLGFGRRQAAFDRLGQELANKSAGLIFASSMPIWREVETDPRFEAILDEIGLWG